ncbi:phage holin family protein [Blastococcus xanthinilyticus]|uniref:Putative superfamily III holin-X n=1 Tax=Blastococcus xanthinilyticus TaxID=1564164 RepID=A0A5S5CVF2_9ACTN|nr:phage holin family protein [Blastococcus xanthinilyticus]TYP87074.1 putative superfamily III holin-X [Blastococcus xanthinilyticus]
MAHSVSQIRTDGASPAVEPSIGTLVQSAMADVSTLVRNEIELAKAEIGASAKKGGISAASFAAAGVFAAFAGIFFFIALAEFLTWLGLARWISYAIVFLLLITLAGIAALVGKKMIDKIEKPERTIESLKELPEVMHREAPGARHRDVPVVNGGKVELRGNESYRV